MYRRVNLRPKPAEARVFQRVYFVQPYGIFRSGGKLAQELSGCQRLKAFPGCSVTTETPEEPSNPVFSLESPHE